jgi:hypothetical protein
MTDLTPVFQMTDLTPVFANDRPDTGLLELFAFLDRELEAVGR